MTGWVQCDHFTHGNIITERKREKKLSHSKDFGTFITKMDMQSKVVNSLIALIGHTEINNTEFMPFKYLK